MANFNISYIFEAIDRFSPTLKKISNSINNLEEKVNKFQSRMKATAEGVSNLGKSLSLRISAPLLAFGGVAIKAASDMESLTQRIKPFVGSTKDAQKFVKQLTEYTAKTPFTTFGQGTGEAAQTLLKFKVQAKDVIPLLKEFGNAAAVGGGSEALQTIARVYGEATNQGIVYTQHLRQLLYAGVPVYAIIKDMAQKAGIKESVEDLASKGAITAEVLKKVFDIYTGPGGNAYKASEGLAKTLGGLFSTVKDNITLSMAEIGEFIVKVLNLRQYVADFIDIMIKFRAHFKSFVEAHKTLASIAVVIGVILAFLGPIILILGQIGLAFIGLTSIVTTLGVAINFAFLPITLIIGVILAIAAGIAYLAWRFKPVREAFYEFYLNVKAIYEIFLKFYDLLGKVAKFTGLTAFIKWLSPEGKRRAEEEERSKQVIDVLGGSSKVEHRSRVNVSFYDPTGLIKGIETLSEPGVSLAVGRNMAHV